MFREVSRTRVRAHACRTASFGIAGQVFLNCVQGRLYGDDESSMSIEITSFSSRPLISFSVAPTRLCCEHCAYFFAVKLRDHVSESRAYRARRS